MSELPDQLESVDQRVVGVPWPMFRAWIRDVWRPGQHWAAVGPTGKGKTTFVVGILQDRRHVLALDPKGGDSNLARSGYERITRWPPPPRIRERIADGRGAKLIVGPVIKTAAQRPGLTDLFRKALTGAFDEGGWTVYVDEFQIAADRRMMNLGSESETLLVAARDKGISVVTAYQAPAWVPTAATRQATWVALWKTRDQDVIKKMASQVGRPWRELEAAVRYLPEHYVLVAGPDADVPLVMTHPPKL